MLLSGNEAISNQDVELGDAAAKYKGQCWSIVLLKSVWKKIRVLSLDRAIPIDNFSVSKKRSPLYVAKNLAGKVIVIYSLISSFCYVL